METIEIKTKKVGSEWEATAYHRGNFAGCATCKKEPEAIKQARAAGEFYLKQLPKAGPVGGAAKVSVKVPTGSAVMSIGDLHAAAAAGSALQRPPQQNFDQVSVLQMVNRPARLLA